MQYAKHSFKQYYDVRTLGKTSIKPDYFVIVLVILFDYRHEQTRYLSTAFLPSVFKLYTLE